jgi:hypothetical protein
MTEWKKPSKASRRRYGLRIHLTRLALNLSEEQAATEWGCTVPTYRKWVAGETRGMKMKHILPFVARHDINLDWLICGDHRKIGGLFGAPGKIAILQTARRAACPPMQGTAA